VVKHGSKNVYQKEQVFKFSKLDCMLKISNSQHNQGDPYGHISSTRSFTLTTHKIFVRGPTIMREVAMPRFGFANHLALIACII
jgi:hypothetical protein